MQPHKAVLESEDNLSTTNAVELASTGTIVHSPAVVCENQNTQGEPRRDDPMRRFIPTPCSADLPVMGRTIRLETNSSKILRHMVELFARYPGAPNGDAGFRWRIVLESDVQVRPPWPRRSAFSEEGLRFAEFGQRNFLAVDLKAREAIGILSESLAEDNLGLTIPFLDSLFCLTASSLGLTPLWANCVARGQSGVLLLGSPNSGKTCAGYVAETLGLDFYADDGVFLELDSEVLRGWSGFWPATFRPEALHFFPELGGRARPCVHQDFILYHTERRQEGRTSCSWIQPRCCLLLKRQCSRTPGLSRIARTERARLLAESVLFKEDDCFTEQQTKVLRALETLPAYVLRYGSDPSIAAATARDLLAAIHRPGPGQEALGGQGTEG
jgi:hypothetical protein